MAAPVSSHVSQLLITACDSQVSTPTHPTQVKLYSHSLGRSATPVSSSAPPPLKAKETTTQMFTMEKDPNSPAPKPQFPHP